MSKLKYDAEVYEQIKPTKGWSIGDKCYMPGTNEHGIVVGIRYQDLVIEIDGRNVVFNVNFVQKEPKE